MTSFSLLRHASQYEALEKLLWTMNSDCALGHCEQRRRDHLISFASIVKDLPHEGVVEKIQTVSTKGPLSFRCFIASHYHVLTLPSTRTSNTASPSPEQRYCTSPQAEEAFDPLLPGIVV
jgi:hypothetical protein